MKRYDWNYKTIEFDSLNELEEKMNKIADFFPSSLKVNLCITDKTIGLIRKHFETHLW